MAALIPEHKTHHPLGTHRKRVENRAAMNAIFFVLRTGCQWNALNATGICSCRCPVNPCSVLSMMTAWKRNNVFSAGFHSR